MFNYLDDLGNTPAKFDPFSVSPLRRALSRFLLVKLMAAILLVGSKAVATAPVSALLCRRRLLRASPPPPHPRFHGPSAGLRPARHAHRHLAVLSAAIDAPVLPAHGYYPL